MARWKGNAVTFQTVPCMSASSDHVKFGGGVPKSGTYVLEDGTHPSNRPVLGPGQFLDEEGHVRDLWD